MLCCAVLCCAVLCCAVLCCAVLCCAVLCCAVLGGVGGGIGLLLAIIGWVYRKMTLAGRAPDVEQMGGKPLEATPRHSSENPIPTKAAKKTKKQVMIDGVDCEGQHQAAGDDLLRFL
jgi:hypothetical protein